MTKVVYLIGHPGSSVAKIGRTANLPKRLAAIQSTCPVQVEVLWQADGGSALESALHQHFRSRRIHGEWFEFGDADAIAEVAQAVEAIEAVAAVPPTAPYVPSKEVATLFARYRRAKEEEEALRPLVKERAVRVMSNEDATVGALHRLTGMTDEVFRRLARDNGIERRREPTVGKDAKPKPE